MDFAVLDINSKVIGIHPIPEGISEQQGIDYLFKELQIKKNYPNAITAKAVLNTVSIGDYFDKNKNAFIPVKPFESWILDSSGLNWIAPVEKPNDEKKYFWNESKLNWEEF